MFLFFFFPVNSNFSFIWSDGRLAVLLRRVSLGHSSNIIHKKMFYYFK